MMWFLAGATVATPELDVHCIVVRNLQVDLK
jgi:hypothetical protein